MTMYTLSSMAETDGGRRQFSLNRVPCKLYKEGHKINNILLELKFLVLKKVLTRITFMIHNTVSLFTNRH